MSDGKDQGSVAEGAKTLRPVQGSLAEKPETLKPNPMDGSTGVAEDGSNEKPTEQKIDWDLQKKLLKKRQVLSTHQNDEMFKLVERIEAEEKERKDQLLKSSSEEERIKLRKQHIDKKAACQKQIKELMKKHHEENEYLEQKIEDDKNAEARKQNPDDEAGQEEQAEQEAGQEEQDGADQAGEEEMELA